MVRTALSNRQYRLRIRHMRIQDCNLTTAHCSCWKVSSMDCRLFSIIFGSISRHQHWMIQALRAACNSARRTSVPRHQAWIFTAWAFSESSWFSLDLQRKRGNAQSISSSTAAQGDAKKEPDSLSIAAPPFSPEIHSLGQDTGRD